MANITKTTIVISHIVDHVETFTFNRKLTPEEYDRFSSSGVRWSDLEEGCDEMESEEIDHSASYGYNVEISEE
jgi:hypothetical protein